MPEIGSQTIVHRRPSRRPTDELFLELARGCKVGANRASTTTSQDMPAARDPTWAVAVAIAAAIGLIALAIASGRASCAPVHYVINPQDAPEAALETIHEAFRRVGRETGQTYVFDGLTTAIPSPSSMSTTPLGDPTVLVAWLSGTSLASWAGGRRVIGFAQGSRDPATGAVYSGAVVLSRDASLPLGFAGRRSWGGVLIHELGHLVGLEHSSDRTEIMYPHLTSDRLEWSPAEHRQLHDIGVRAGCDPR